LRCHRVPRLTNRPKRAYSEGIFLVRSNPQGRAIVSTKEEIWRNVEPTQENWFSNVTSVEKVYIIQEIYRDN